MTILWVDVISELGGAQRSMYEACVGLSKLGIDITAAVPYGPLFELLKAAGLTVYPISTIRARKRGWGLFTTTAKLLRAPGTIRQIAHAVRPDIIHTNSLSAFLATERGAGRIPLFWHVRDLKVLPLVARDAAQKAERIIASSEAIDEHLADIISPRLMGRIRVVRNGINTDLFAGGDKADTRRRFGLPSTAPVIGMIAHIVPWKRHEAFIETAALIRQRHPDAHFIAVGKDLFNEYGRYTAKLEALVAQAEMGGRFHWIRDLDAVEQILPAFDVLVHPALHEPFGRVICEAMASGVPVVAAESGGPATIIEQNVSGILVRDGDPQGLATETLALLDDPQKAARLTDTAKKVVHDQFTIQRVCEQLLKEYQNTLISLHIPDKTKDD